MIKEEGVCRRSGAGTPDIQPRFTTERGFYHAGFSVQKGGFRGEN